MARTLDDVLARRTRALYLNARAAVEMAPAAVRLMAQELGREEFWQQEQIEAFRDIARNFTVAT
jgi:glycerol-3-phosphate dehydrogenase